MLEADYWRAQCSQHVNGQELRLCRDQWCQRLLADVSDGLDRIADGRIWTFRDGSRLFATTKAVRVWPGIVP